MRADGAASTASHAGWCVPFVGRGSVLRAGGGGCDPEREKGVRWMPWRQEAMKDVARCEKPRGDASDR